MPSHYPTKSFHLPIKYRKIKAFIRKILMITIILILYGTVLSLPNITINHYKFRPPKSPRVTWAFIKRILLLAVHYLLKVTNIFNIMEFLSFQLHNWGEVLGVLALSIVMTKFLLNQNEYLSLDYDSPREDCAPGRNTLELMQRSS